MTLSLCMLVANIILLLVITVIIFLFNILINPGLCKIYFTSNVLFNDLVIIILIIKTENQAINTFILNPVSLNIICFIVDDTGT